MLHNDNTSSQISTDAKRSWAQGLPSFCMYVSRGLVGNRRCCPSGLLFVAVLIAQLGGGVLLTAQQPTPNRLGASAAAQQQAKNLGIRILTGKHITLFTDISDREDIDELVEVFDQAMQGWCDYFSVSSDLIANWHFSGMVLVDRDKFRRAGLFPDSLPPFPAGYQQGNNFWVYLQEGDYYTRHLLLHEGTHAFMQRAFGRVGDPWYAEGMAELLAVHRWNGETLQLNFRQNRREDVPYWGRVKILKEAVAAQSALRLPEVLAAPVESFRDVKWYAWGWAACRFFDNHPRYQDSFRAIATRLERGDASITPEFWESLDSKEKLRQEWSLFLLEIEQGIDWPAAFPTEARPVSTGRVEIDAARGWQATNLTLQKGQQVRVSAEGRFVIAVEEQTWEATANGVTIEYFRGQPMGMLVGAIVNPDMPTAQLKILPVGAAKEWTAMDDGVLFLKINDHPARLEDNSGKLTVELQAVERP